MTQPVVSVNSYKGEPRVTFPDRQSYEQFRRGYRARVVPKLEAHRRAHQASEMRALRHRVCDTVY